MNNLMNALENESNASIMDLTSAKVKSQKNDISTTITTFKGKVEIISSKKLKHYRYCSDLRDIQYGHYIRWVPLKNPEKIIFNKWRTHL